jgi:hypothetical protein
MRIWGFIIDRIYVEVILNANHSEKKSLTYKNFLHHRNNAIGVLFDKKTNNKYYFNRDNALHLQVLNAMNFDKKNFIFLLEYPDKLLITHPKKEDIKIEQIIKNFNITENNIDYVKNSI